MSDDQHNSKNRSHKSQHKMQADYCQNSKFKNISKGNRNYSTQSNNSSQTNQGQEQQRQYHNLSKKLAQKQKLKVGTRNFNKTFYGKLAKKIIQKPISFYKFGLKQDQKASCKTVFSQLFKIKPQKLKGTITISELWDDKSTMKYLKQNQMFFNKDILMKQFQCIDKEQKLRRKQMQISKERQFVKKYRQMVKENEKLNENNRNYQQMKEMNANEACAFIRTQIDRLADSRYCYRMKTKSRKIIDGLQKNYDNFDKIAHKFKNKMIFLL